MASTRTQSFFWVAVILAACSSTSSKPRSVPVNGTFSAVPSAAPSDKLLPFEEGVVTYDWTLVLHSDPTQHGQAWLAFDSWGNRQATVGHPKRGRMVMLSDGERQTRYADFGHRAVVTSRQTVTIFYNEEGRTLRDVGTSKESGSTVVGIRCQVTSTVTRLPTRDTVTHSECVGAGIPLEVTDAVTGPNVKGSWLKIVASRIDLHAKAPQAWFEIPADATVIEQHR